MFEIKKTKTLMKKTLGFTLTELVVTTAIMGTLAAVAIPSYVETQAKSKSEKTMSNIAEMGARLGQVYTELTGVYGGVSLVTTTVGTAKDISNSEDILTEYVGDTGGAAAFTKKWSDIFPSGVPISPFDDKPYKMNVTETGEVNYTFKVGYEGNVDISYKAAVIQIYDPEDPLAFSMEFTF